MPEKHSTATRQRPQRGDLTGRKFRLLMVIKYVGRDKNRNSLWLCHCECGKETITCSAYLKNGDTKSCGCLNSKTTVARNTTHNLYGTPEHRNWTAMIARCENPNVKVFHNYGGRGIRVCERWRTSFAAFYQDMGLRPTAQHTVDRFPDPDGNYEPDNCRWATRAEQSRNQKRNRLLTFNGKVRCLQDWATLSGISAASISKRLKKGWTVEQALSTPTRGKPGSGLNQTEDCRACGGSGVK